MPKSKYSFHSGPKLLEILSFTEGAIKVLGVGGQLLGHLPIDRASLLVKAGSYVGKCSHWRVYHLREVETRRPNSHSKKYWDDFKQDLPVVQPYPYGKKLGTTFGKVLA